MWALRAATRRAATRATSSAVAPGMDHPGHAQCRELAEPGHQLRVVDGQRLQQHDLGRGLAGGRHALAQARDAGLQHLGVRAGGDPALAEAHRAADGMRRRTADDDRWARRARAEQEGLAVRLDLIALEALVQKGERRVGYRTPAPAIHAEHSELPVHPADPDAEDQPPSRQFLDRSDPLRAEEGGTVGDDQHANGQADAFGDPGEKRERRQRLEVAPVRSFRILGRERQVIGDPEIVDAGLLRGAGRIRDQRAGRLRTHVAQVQAELHVPLRLHGAGATRVDAPPDRRFPPASRQSDATPRRPPNRSITRT